MACDRKRQTAVRRKGQPRHSAERLLACAGHPCVPAWQLNRSSRLQPAERQTEFAEGRYKAIGAYASQFYQADSKEPATRISQPGFLRENEDRMRYYGSLIGVEAGEAFYVREALNVEDPFALLTRPMNIYS